MLIESYRTAAKMLRPTWVSTHPLQFATMKLSVMELGSSLEEMEIWD